MLAIGIDVDLAGLVLAEIQRLGHIGLLLFSPAGGQFLPQSDIFRHELLQLNFGFRINGRRSGRLVLQKCGVEGPLGVICAVAVGHEIQKDKEVFQTQRRLLLADFLPRVGGVVAQGADQLHPAPDVLTNDVPEILVIHQRNQPVVIGQHQRAVHGIHPLDGKLHGPPAVQHAGSRVDM